MRTPLTLSVVSIKKRRIEAAVPGSKIKAVEHYSPLRFLFPGMILSSENAELPYFTSAGLLAGQLISSAFPLDLEVPWYTISDACLWQYPELRGGREGYTLIEPDTEKKLSISVNVKFKRFGELTRHFVFPDEELLFKVLDAQPLGIPSWLKYPAKFLWAHGKDVYWPKKGSANILETIILHRVQDILGALALLESPIPGGFPALKIYSQCSGHLADLKALAMVHAVPL